MGDQEHESWTWPDELDALAAAPESHKLLFENDATRVLDARIAPGEMARLHTHRWPSVLYVISLGHFVRRDGNGTVVLDSREGGASRRRDLRCGARPYLLIRSRTSTRPRSESSASS